MYLQCYYRGDLFAFNTITLFHVGCIEKHAITWFLILKRAPRIRDGSAVMKVGGTAVHDHEIAVGDVRYPISRCQILNDIVLGACLQNLHRICGRFKVKKFGSILCANYRARIE